MTDSTERTLTPERLAEIIALVQPPTNSSAANIHVNAGGVGVWLCVTLFGVTLAVVALACLFVALQLQDLRKTDDNFQAYINAGYVQPQPEEMP